MADRLPLTEVSGEEILARVAYQVIVHDYHCSPERYDNPTETLLLLAEEWHASGLDVIATELRLVAIWCGNGGTVATWLRSRIVFSAGRATRLALHSRTNRR